MKQLTIHQFKQTVAALALVLVSTAALAQATRIDQWNGINASDAIIRESWNGNQVAYVKQDGNSYFVRHEVSTDQLVYAPTPRNVTVTDFEIHKRTAYFCGVTTIGEVSQAMVGMFDVNALFDGTGSYDYCLFPLSTSSAASNYSLTVPERIDVFDPYDGYIHIAGVGRMNTDVANDRPTIFDVYYDGVGIWHSRMLHNMNDRMEYLDVESSDDQIVVSGLDKSDSTIYKNAFYQHDSFLEDALDAYQMLTKDFSGIVGTKMPDMRFTPALSKESTKNTDK